MGSHLGRREGIIVSEIGSHWFEDMADHMGAAYLRYTFTMGTVQEVDHIVEALALRPGMRVLDVGCGPGRHSHELAKRGISCHGVDISHTFVDIATTNAPAGATFERMDARALTFHEEFDAVICLCQGAFGLMTANGHDKVVLQGIATSLKPGGRVALSAFNAYFAVKYHEAATFNADTGVAYEVTEVRNASGAPKTVDLWTGCYTPRELRLLIEDAGLSTDSISSVEPGAYGYAVPTVESPEYLLIASKTPFRR